MIVQYISVQNVLTKSIKVKHFPTYLTKVIRKNGRQLVHKSCFFRCYTYTIENRRKLLRVQEGNTSKWVCSFGENNKIKNSLLINIWRYYLHIPVLLYWLFIKHNEIRSNTYSTYKFVNWKSTKCNQNDQ